MFKKRVHLDWLPLNPEVPVMNLFDVQLTEVMTQDFYFNNLLKLTVNNTFATIVGGRGLQEPDYTMPRFTNGISLTLSLNKRIISR